MADASGKGMPAALFMMAAKTAIRGAMGAKANLSDAMGVANRSLCEGNDSEMFVTAFAGILDWRTGKLTYVNAGHNKPLVLHDGAWTWLKQRSGPYLGSFDWVDYKQFELQVVNVCNYAYPDAEPGQAGPLRIHFTHRTDPNAVVIEVGDDGMPFNPLAHEDPKRPESIEEATIGGLGLFMTKKFMDGIEYAREGIANVTIITKRWE